MSGTRFARTGKCRFFICISVFALSLAMIAIFHNASQQLDETREKRLHCEQREESLNERLQSCVGKKRKMEQQNESERDEQMEQRRNLEQKLKDLTELHAKEQLEAQVRYDKLQLAHKSLQSKHNTLEAESVKNVKRHLDEIGAMEKKMKTMRADMQKDALSKEKYNSIVREKERLEGLLGTDSKSQLQDRIGDLERKLANCQQYCDYNSKGNGVRPQPSQQQQINKPLHPPDTTRNATPQNGLEKPRNEKSFQKQELVSPGLYHIAVKLTNKTQNNIENNLSASTNNKNKTAATTISSSSNNGVGNAGVNAAAEAAANTLNLKKTIQQLLPYSAQNNRSLIINSVENFQIAPKPMKKLSEETETQLKQQPDVASVAANAIFGTEQKVSPLSAPRKLNSTEATKSELNVLVSNNQLKKANNSAALVSSSTSLPPLPLPPANQRKLPENVAPIPANFEELLQNDQKTVDKENKQDETADIDAAVEEMQKNDNDEGNNNRYANVVKDMAHKASAANEDSGAHEIKDHDFINDQNFNLPAEDDNNFFDAGAGNKHDANVDVEKRDDDNEDEDIIGAGVNGDIAVKNHNRILDADSLNNEVAGDQGKEFPDGIRLEEGNDEDEDEDDYSNPAARQQGAQAIRN